jgi:hypothetical protein
MEIAQDGGWLMLEHVEQRDAHLLRSHAELFDCLTDAQETCRKLLNGEKPERIPQFDPQRWGAALTEAAAQKENGNG